MFAVLGQHVSSGSWLLAFASQADFANSLLQVDTQMSAYV
jgi:hypothetical protein